MAYAYKKGASFVAGYKDARGRQVRKTLPRAVKTLTEARRKAEQLELEAWEVSSGIRKERAPDVTLAAAVSAYLAALPEDYASRKDLKGRLYNFILPGLGADTLVRDVKAAGVMVMLGRLKSVKKDRAGNPKPLSAQTRENVRMAGQGLFTFLAEKAHLLEPGADNPFKAAGAVRVPKREVRYFEAQHLPLLFRQLKPHYVPICAAGLLLAVRKGELRVALKKDYRRAERYLLLRSGGHRDTTKGGKERRVPVPEVLVPVLDAQMATPGPYLFPRPGSSEPFSKHWRVHEVIRRACKRAGLPEDLRFKHFRSTWGTHAYQATGDIRMVQAVLGHADVATTEGHYARALPAHLQQGANRVAAGLSEVAVSWQGEKPEETQGDARKAGNAL